MRRSGSERPLAIGAALGLGWLACTPPEPVAPPPPPPASAPPAPPPPAPPGRRPGRTALTEPRETPLGFVLQPIPGGRSALAVSQYAGDRAAWVRRLGDSGPGPVLRFADQHVLGAFDRGDGTTNVVTSDGARLCFGTTSRSDGRTCVQSSPAAVVPVGDRLALLELSSSARQPPKEVAPAPSKAKPKRKHPAGSSAGKGKKGGGKPAGGKPAGGKKKPAASGPARRPSHPIVELFVRWVEPGGAVDAEAKTTGLHFEAPLDGMALADARARPPGIDVLWFETAPNRKARSALGSGRLMAASLRADGSLDFGSRVAVLDADLEYGQLKDHHAPRLAGTGAASVYVGLDAKGHCEAIRVLPTLGHPTFPPAACAVAPDRLAGPVEAAETAAFERIFAADPRRAFGQPKGDPGLVAWAGDRGYLLHGTTLRSASRADGAVRDEPHPFPARRAPIAWGAFAPDGEGVAIAGDVAHVSTGGQVDHAGLPAGAVHAVVGASELPPDRRRAVRIGGVWWTARGPRATVWPDQGGPGKVADPDTSVLVGGPQRGLSLALTGGSLAVETIAENGVVWIAGSLAPAPVRAGFDACERGRGGALVAGVRASDPAQVVAFALDAAGHAAGAPRPVPLPIRAGDLGVRLVPLPGGGALLTDLDRRHVVWLDDDATVLGAAPWPAATSDAVCPYGRPMPLSVPGPAPGQLVPVPGVAEGACITGDAAWAPDGSLRWFGGTAEGLDFTPELAVLPLLAPTPASPSLAAPVQVAGAPPAGASAPAKNSCPPEMVSIAGRFCVDRFEAMVVDARTGAALSPDYPTTPNLLDFVLAEWATGRERAGNAHARAFPLPWISPARLGDKPEPVAVPRLGVRPSGYLTGVVAEAACAAAGKRLCSLDEFVTACRGQDDTLFPYGETYEEGVCNVFRDEHPAALLHGNASIGHLDPRLDRVFSRGRPLLQRTGESPACRSRWGDDAVYDMVGNLDEWVDEGNGAFAGGFFSRSTRSGCEAVVTAHPRTYLDYSTGVRCCKDVR